MSTDSNSSVDQTSKASLEAAAGDAEVAAEAAANETPTEGSVVEPDVETDVPQEDEAGGLVADASESKEDAAATKSATTKSAGSSSSGTPSVDEHEEDLTKQWYILKVQVNREDSIRDALVRRVKIEGLDEFFGDVVVPTEDVAEFTKSGKRRIVKKKLYPGYIMVHMVINDDTWFAVRETPGIGDFTGSAGKPTPMEQSEAERILNLAETDEDGDAQIKTSIPYSPGDRVRVKEGYFQNFEGEVDVVDEANGRVTVMINIFGRSTPVELEHWQIESI